MKIQLSYDRPSQIQTELLVVIVDKATPLFDLGGSSLNETVQRVSRDIDEKKIKKEYFTALDGKSSVKNLVVFSTALCPSYNAWENLKTFVSRSVRIAQDLSLSRITILL